MVLKCKVLAITKSGRGYRCKFIRQFEQLSCGVPISSSRPSTGVH